MCVYIILNSAHGEIIFEIDMNRWDVHVVFGAVGQLIRAVGLLRNTVLIQCLAHIEWSAQALLQNRESKKEFRANQECRDIQNKCKRTQA